MDDFLSAFSRTVDGETISPLLCEETDRAENCCVYKSDRWRTTTGFYLW